MSWKELSTDDAHELTRTVKDLVVLDVRSPAEYVGPCGHLQGSVLIPINELQDRWRELEIYRDKPILAICYTGVRSRAACGYLAHLGFKTLYNAPGMMDWHDRNYEVVPGEPTPDMPEC